MVPDAGSAGLPGAGARWWMSDRFRWVVLLVEFAVIYGLIVVSHYRGWAVYNHFRFLLLIPMYQAGSAFGYAGGTLMGLLALFVTIPIIPFGDLNSVFQFNAQSNIVLALLYLGFGVVVGGTVGEARFNQRRVESLSDTFVGLFSERDEDGVMRRACGEALAATGGLDATAVLRAGVDGSGGWRFAGGDVLAPEDGVLVWCAVRNAAFATNCAEHDGRLLAGAGSGVRSFLAMPVAFEDVVYGAILVAGKVSGDNFHKKDMEMVKMIAEASGGAIHNMIQERKRQEERLREEQMRELFSRYVSSSVADYVLEHPDLLAGSWKDITLLVSDIRGFTEMSERLPARELVGQLNEYFSAMVDVVFEHGGTIDKFIGDCIIAYWGAPAPDEGHAGNAVRAAVAMAGALGVLNESWAGRGMPVLDTGIGIHTCRVLMGNVGDERKRAFTILGGEVERAVRLEGLTKTLGAKIVVSERAARECGVELVRVGGGPEWAGEVYTVPGVLL